MPGKWFVPVILLMAAVPLAFSLAPRALSADYHIAINPPRGPDTDCDVLLELEHVPNDSLVLFVAADRTALPIKGFSVTDLNGTPLHFTRQDRIISLIGDKRISQPRFVLTGPLPKRCRVTYRTTIGVRQGDTHVGFNGQAFGLALPDAVVFSGRSVFLVPATRTPVHHVTVSFATPMGWDVVAPWTRRGSQWVMGMRNADPLEHLVSATVGVGKFSFNRFKFMGTDWTIAIPRAVPGQDAALAQATLEHALRYVVSIFHRGLGPNYLALALPKSTLGDEVPSEGWGTGQGGTFLPATRTRVRTFVEQLVDAYLLHPPYRSTLNDSRDFWFPSGLRRYYGTTALVETGLMASSELASAIAVRLATSPGTDNGGVRLEKDFQYPGQPVPGGEATGAALLYDLDQKIRHGTNGARSLDAVVAEAFNHSRARSPWDVLPGIAKGNWVHYRGYYAAEGHFAPLESFSGLPILAESPDPSPGPVRQYIRLACTGNSGSFLENCGCKVNQSGGAARRGTMLRRLRDEGMPLLYVDAGNAFPSPGSFQPADPLSQAEAKLALEIMKSQGLCASAISTDELTWGLDFFRYLDKSVSPPFVSFVADSAGRPLAPPFRIVSVAGLRVALFSAFDPPTYVDAQGSYENHAREFRLPDPFRVLPSAIAEVRPRVDLVGVIGRMSPFFIRRLVAACPDIDLVISNESYAWVTGQDATGKRIFDETDRPGFLGRTLVIYTDLGQYGMTAADLGLTSGGKIASAHITGHQLTEDVPDDPQVRARLSAFYQDVGRSLGGMALVSSPFAGDPTRWNGEYAGAEACRTCHTAEYDQWRRTPHANAYKTLLDAHRNYQPRCVACHVVAYGAPHGYRFGDPSSRLVNVQCEVCHGPGAAHARNPAATPALNGADRNICVSCHTPDHSETFVFEERLPAVLHFQNKMPMVASNPRSARKQGTPSTPSEQKEK